MRYTSIFLLYTVEMHVGGFDTYIVFHFNVHVVKCDVMLSVRSDSFRSASCLVTTRGLSLVFLNMIFSEELLSNCNEFTSGYTYIVL